MVAFGSVCAVVAWLVLAAPGLPRASASSFRWVAPLAGPLVVRRAFDPPAVRWGAGHRGVDLAARPGAVVRSAGAGHVAYAGLLAGRGVLVVRHGALRTTYEPVHPLVRAGATVAAGEAVALLAAGHAPARTGEALLHWGLLRGDTYLDPLLLLRHGPSRLLPVGPPPAAAAPVPPRAPPPSRLPAGVLVTTAPAPSADRSPRPPPLAGAAVAGLAGLTVWWGRRRGPP